MKKTIPLFFIFSLILSSILVFPLSVKAEGTLENPSFETHGDKPTKAANWQDFHKGYRRVFDKNKNNWNIKLINKASSDMSGAYQRIDLNQTAINPVYIGAKVRGRKIVLAPDGYFGASIYAEIHFLTSDKVVYWNSEPNQGTFGWRSIGFNTASLPDVDEPISYIYVVPILAQATGKAFFNDIVAREYSPQGGAVTLMFDDGEISTYNLAKPEMDQYNMAGVTSVVTSFVGSEDLYMGWDKIKELYSAGWEVVSHSITHSDLTQLSKRKMVRELAKSKRIIEKRGITVNSFVYPYGAYNDLVQANTALRYRSARAYEHGDNPMGVNPMNIKIRSVEDGTTVEEVESWLERAQNDSRWQVIIFHRIAEEGDDSYYVTPDMFSDIIAEINASGVPVLTYNEGLNQFAAE